MGAESLEQSAGNARLYCEYFGQRLLAYKRRFGSSDYKVTLEGARAQVQSPDLLLTVGQIQSGLQTIIQMMNSPGFDWSHVSRIYVSSS